MRVLFWFRKDLRLDDNAGLAQAARDGDVVPFYSSEPAILSRPDIAATRVSFVLDALVDLAAACERAGSHLALDHGDAGEIVLRAARECGADGLLKRRVRARASPARRCRRTGAPRRRRARPALP